MIDMVVIGAVMSGIACTRALRIAGAPIRLIVKRRGIGGRTATRRAPVSGNSIKFDLGAQYLDQSGEAANIAALGHEILDTWSLSDGTCRIFGVPTMTALPKALANGLSITFNTLVRKLRARSDPYAIETNAGRMTASHVDITVPAPQLAPILGKTTAIFQQASGALMLRCLTLMAAFNPNTPASFKTKRDVNSVLSWMSQNNTKLGRSKAYQTWVAQAQPGWSTTNIDVDRSEINAQILGLLCSELDVDPTKLCYADLQGWRYGMVEKPLGLLFVKLGTLWAGGDWYFGTKVQDVWQSCTDITANVLHSLETSSSVRSEVATQSC